jgi:mannose-6-phosphate isomerase-like protein (cupin superfamily)
MSCRKRPWDECANLHVEVTSQVKKFAAYPGRQLSLKDNEIRTKRWAIVSGTEITEIGGSKQNVRSVASLDTKPSAVHRFASTLQETSISIEVQTRFLSIKNIL